MNKLIVAMTLVLTALVLNGGDIGRIDDSIAFAAEGTQGGNGVRAAENDGTHSGGGAPVRATGEGTLGGGGAPARATGEGTQGTGG